MARPPRARALPAPRSLPPLLLAGALLSAGACSREPAPASPPPASAAPAPGTPGPGVRPPLGDATVRKATTGVFRTGAGGASVRARDGEPLRVGDGLRTTWGNAEVALPDGSVVRLDERTELRVVALDATGVRLALVRGRVQVDPARAGSSPPRLELPEGGVSAAGQGGRWAALATPSTLSVAAVKGPVRLESAGAAVEVGPGSTSTASRGRAPLVPAPGAPALSVVAPAEGVQVPPDVCAVVQGAAAPGAEVRVAGRALEAAADGSFAVTVPRDGRPAVVIAVRHASGATERRTVPCAEAALSGFEVEWDER